MVAAIGLPRAMVACVGLNERSGRGATRLVARVGANPAYRCELGRCRLEASKNAGCCCGGGSLASIS